MNYDLITTYKCNLNCRYCGAVRDDDDIKAPAEVQYDLNDLKKFMEKDADPYISFYGGEPLLRISLIEKVMDTIKAEYLLQTNALRLDKVKPEYLKRFHTILVSIDGGPDVTDFYRGKGTHAKILKNIKDIRKKGFTGFLIARMTAAEKMDIEREVRWLIDFDEPAFDKIHWQVDFEFSDISHWNNVENWINEKYNPGITALIDYWHERMASDGVVLKIMPFLGVMNSILNDTTEKLRCGCGWIDHTISTNGNLYACPVVSEYDVLKTGNIYETEIEQLRDAILVGEPCTECDVFGLCGGRCLLSNATEIAGQGWEAKDTDLVCFTVRHLINELRRVTPSVVKLLDQKRISLNDFEYIKYDGCEIIP